MKRNTKLAELRNLQSRADALRKELRISRPGDVTFLATRDGMDDEIVVVEADGFGGATMSIVIGNYPVDYTIKFEEPFPTERAAEDAAEEMAFRGNSLVNI